MEQLCDHACDEADDDGPKDAHRVLRRQRGSKTNVAAQAFVPRRPRFSGFFGAAPDTVSRHTWRAWSQAGRQGTQTKPAPIEIGAGHLRDAETARTLRR